MQRSTPYLLAIIFVLALLVAGNVFQFNRTKKLTDERDRYKNNTEVLMGDVEQYKVRDSLNVARVQSLELTLDEFKRFRAEDTALIKQLKTKNRDLQSVVTSQSQSIYELSAIPKDTVIVRDSVMIDALLLHCGDEWFDFDGIMSNGKLDGNMITRDSLLLAETVKYKRFLGFLWKTNKIQNRMIDVISKNPHTLIQNVEFITIEE